MENIIKTPHINAKLSEIANVVIMPGDPIRALNFAKKMLKNYKPFNGIRGNTGYTGEYKGTRISIMASGMGMPTMGIYSYELYTKFNVDVIIRMGSCGGYKESLKPGTLVCATKAFSESMFDKENSGKIPAKHLLNMSENGCKEVEKVNNSFDYNLKMVTCHSADVFYNPVSEIWNVYKKEGYDIDVVEMEAFALQSNANRVSKELNKLKTAIAIFFVSDNLISHEFMSAQEREVGTEHLFELTAEVAKSFQDKINNR